MSEIEKDLYPSVERWARRRLNAWNVRLDAGLSIGRIDVVAVREFGGGELASRSEIVAVEVKRGNWPFMKAVGQAYGYSVMADRCYLAVQCAGFSEQEELIASRLGVGLLAISESGRIREVTTAPVQDPIPELRLRLVNKLNLGLCALCSTIFALGEGDGQSNQRRVHKNEWGFGGLEKAARAQRGMVWFLYEAAGEDVTGFRRYLCSDCVRSFAPAATERH